MKDIIKHSYNGAIVSQEPDGCVSLTDMAKASDKQVTHYLRLDVTKAYLKALSIEIGVSTSTLIFSVKGKGKKQGTWAHPIIAANFSQWCKSSQNKKTTKTGQVKEMQETNNENSTNLSGQDKIAKLLFEDIMQSISTDTIAWKLQSQLRAIDTFYANCPTCDELKAIKTDSGAVTDQACKTISQSAKCTFCGQHFKVFVIDPLIDEDLSKEATCESVWAYPTGNNPRKLIFNENDLPIRIFRSYKSAVDVFNKKSWAGTLALCGATIEGIYKKHFPKAKNADDLGKLLGKLNESLKTDSQYLPLLEPMKTLSDALYLGRHKGAHFDLEKDPDRQVAAMVLDATEFLIRYFYTLTKDAESLKQKILALNPEHIEDKTSKDSA